MVSNKKEGFIDLFKNFHIKKYVSGSSLLTYFISNLLVFLVIAEFFKYNSINSLSSGLIKWTYFIIGISFSFLLIKTNYLIRSSTKKETKSERSKIEEGDFKLNIGKWNMFIIFLRLVFFNVMNDLFIVLIIWSILFSLGYVTSLVTIVPGTFSILVGLLSIMGILAGIFQFYIQTYKERISQQVINNLIKHLTRTLKKYSFKDFLEYNEKQNKSFFNEIDDNLKRNPFYAINQVSRGYRRSAKEITNITLNVLAENDILLAQSLEYSNIDKGKLKEAYKAYFENKNKEIKKEIDKLNFDEIRKILFPNIIFFDEIAPQLVSSSYDFENIEKPESYTEFLSNYAQENSLYLIEKLFEVGK